MEMGNTNRNTRVVNDKLTKISSVSHYDLVDEEADRKIAMDTGLDV